MGRTGIGLLCLYLCCFTPTSYGQLVNVARGKTCNQSTYHYKKHPPSFAVNGETSGDYGLPNCIHTDYSDYAPWFQVDLGRKYSVYDITLWARTNYYSRLYPLTITVDGQLCVKAYTTGSRNQSLTCSSPVYGQVVRLTKDYEHAVNYYFLNLCEVQIWCCNVGWYGDRCDSQCSTKTPRCTQCVQDGGQCTECSSHFKSPWCTDCERGYYRSGSTCVPCNRGCEHNYCDPDDGTCIIGCREGYYSSGSDCIQCSNGCKSGQCDRVSGRCTQGCNAGWYGDRCNTQCSTKTPRCTQCVQDGGQCTECSGHFQSPQCTDCEDGYYRSGSTCVQCSRGCKNNQCDPVSGTCTQGCKDGYYTSGSTCVQCSSNCKSGQCDPVSGRCTRGCTPGYHGDQCNLPCSSLDEGCIQCTQRGNCTAYKTKFKHPGCSETLEEQKESLVGPVVAAVVGFIVGMGVMAIIVTAVVCWRRKSCRNVGKLSAIEMSSSAPAKNLHDSAIASSTAGDAVNVYEIVENDNDRTNGRIRQVAPPPSTSAAGVGGNVYENEVKENNYDKLCPYSNGDGDRQPYTDIVHVSTHN